MKQLRFIKNFIKKFLYFKIRTKIGNKYFTVPIVKGVGRSNLKLKNDWFFNLLTKISLPEKSTFIDVGVNVGQTILKFRSLSDNPYLGFEINSNCVNYTRNLIKLNRIKDISIIPVGLSDKNELLTLYSNSEIDNCCEDSTIVSDLRPDRYSDDDKTFVPVYSFDSLNVFSFDNAISMIKIDVEGAELEVLYGMINTIRKFRPLIVCEVLDYNSALSSERLQQRADSLIDLINGLSYDVYSINHSGSNLKFERVSKIKLVLWSQSSLGLNDYLFVPKEKFYLDLN